MAQAGFAQGSHVLQESHVLHGSHEVLQGLHLQGLHPQVGHICTGLELHGHPAVCGVIGVGQAQGQAAKTFDDVSAVKSSVKPA